ncbi:disintegrin and metalloproteinase domain-containing protein 10-like [Dermacentor silvarum]|uniref:disintegrin and metalloproteinase domain-containing protein 10-like n=1 Tax=Dermacentor silvarum TaxID=543639 RepID=UPI0021006A91|nr:disintegrin and metalloproteinase domain-containing protein 10-like [Dermacentor silvarum]
MFANAQTGSAPNNRKFSPCSVANISIVLDEMFTGEGTRPNCFQEPAAPFCGNMIREETEECDCGYDRSDCLDKCCYPRKHPKRCTLRAGAKCSPTSGSCCSENCTIRNTTQPCRPEDECQYAAFCDGMNSECPPSAWKPDGTLCNRGTQLCEAGECQHSVCRRYNLNQCFLTGPDRTPEQMCLIACQEDLPGSECLEACNFKRMKDFCHRRMEPGAACADLRGYCDAFRRCRFIDAHSSLARLRWLTFGPPVFVDVLAVYALFLPTNVWVITPASWPLRSGDARCAARSQVPCSLFINAPQPEALPPLCAVVVVGDDDDDDSSGMMMKYWYLTFLCLALISAVTVAIIRVCAVHMPSSNPLLRPYRKISDSIHHPLDFFKDIAGL